MSDEQEDRRRKIQEVIGSMQKNLECSICLEMMNNPVSTNCGHQFCRFCLMEFLERKKQVPCPLCKKMITKRSLMDRSQLGQMVENVRSLISAFQADTGLLFSPPRGPHTTDLIPCTPDCIQAKTVTEVNGKSTSSLDKKMGKKRNVRISRRKTLDNAEISYNADLEQTSSSAISDSNGTISYVARVNKTLSKGKGSPQSRNPANTDGSSLELLKGIENGVHCKADTLRLHEATECVQPIVADNSDSQNTEIRTNVSSESFQAENSNAEHFSEQNSREQTSVLDAVEISLLTEKETSSENGKLEGIHSCNEMTVHESIREDEGLLFQTPLPPKTIDKLRKRQPDKTDNANHMSKNLRSRDKKISNTAEENDSGEQLTPDNLNDNVTSSKFEQSKHIGDIKTYSKRGLIKQDKEANKKVKEWLKSVEVTEERKEMQNNAGAEIRRKKGKQSKKELKVRAEEEKLGLKMKHLAEHITTDKAAETDHCFGFVEDAEDQESRAKQKDKDEKQAGTSTLCDKNGKTDNQFHTINDMTLDQENQKEKTESVDEDYHLDHASDNEGHVYEIEKTISDTMNLSKEMKMQHPQNCHSHSKSPQHTLLNKKHIFKTKLINTENVTKETITVDSQNEGLAVNESKMENNTTVLCQGAENRLPTDQDLPDSDPYEFKSSGNTPRKIGQKKGKAAKVKKKITKPAQKTVGGAKRAMKNKNFKGKQNANSEVISIDDTPISCTQEEIKKISNKLNQAEDYDLLTCTQEAVDSLQKDSVSLNNKKIMANPVGTEMVDIDEHVIEKKSKASQQKKVRFREPLISDFVVAGKIDILSYRKVKEKIHNSESSLNDIKNTSEVEHENSSRVEVPKLEEEINAENDMTQSDTENESKNDENVDQDNNDDHNQETAVDNDHQKKKTSKDSFPSYNVERKSPVMKMSDTVDRMTPVKTVDSTAVVYKNPMMTPTSLKRSPGSKLKEENDTLEDEINSSGTDDLDIHPEEDQFEEPVLEIQPDDIREKFSSQELFVRNVLSSPQECARRKPSPQIIEETPMVFSVPTPNTFRKPKRDKDTKTETYTDQNILTVCETPLIPTNGSLTDDVNKPMSEEQSIKISGDSEASTKEFKNSPKGTSSKDNVESQEESDETQPPSDIVVPSIVKHSQSLFISQSYSNNGSEPNMITEEESSVENSVSLLNPHDNDLNVPVIDITNNNEDVIIENKVEENERYVDVKTPVPKSKKKRKSFMLDEDDDETSSLSVSAPVQNATKQVPKRKKLSRSAQKSNTNIENVTKNQSLNNVVCSKNVQSNSNGNRGLSPAQKSGLILSKNTLSSLESEQDAENSLSPSFNVDKSLRSRTKLLQMANMDIVTISESAQSDLNTVDPQTLTASCVPQTNSDEHVRANSPIKSKQLTVEDSVNASYKDNLNVDVNDESTSKDAEKVSQSENIYMVPETEIIDCSDTPGMIADYSVTSGVNVDKDAEDSQSPKAIELEDEHENRNSQSVSTNFEIDKSQENQNPMKKPKASRKSKMAKKSENLDLKKTRSNNNHRHLSGMLNSPDENILCSVGKGSPEDIFNMDSELPFVDNSPFEGENQPVFLSEETITNDMLLAQEKKSEHVGSNAHSNNSNDNTDHDLSRIHVKVEKKETTLRQRKGRWSKISEVNEAKNSRAESDSESDLSQQARKRKRQSGVKGARGLANRKKQSGSSNSNSDLGSPLLPGTPGFKTNTLRKNSDKTGLETAAHKEVVEPSVIDLSESAGNQNIDNKKLPSEIDDNETTNDLPDLSQRMSQQQKHSIDADSNIVNSAVSHVEESGTELASSVIQIDYEKQKDLANIRLVDKELRQSENKMKAIGNDADSTSSEFELSSSSEHSQNHLETTEPEDIDKCIKEAKDKITDIENTLSEIIDKDSDNESHSLSQEDKDNVIDGKTLKHKELRNSIGVKPDDHYQNADTSSPLPDINTEEPMEVLESDIEVDDNDGPMRKNLGIRNIDSDQGPMVEENRTGERNSDSDEGPVTKKKSKKAVIADSSSEDEDDNSHHMNMTSSSAFSSQSENLTTQDRQALENDLERMAREMEVLKAQLNRGHSRAANRSSSDYTGQSEKGGTQVVAVEDSSDIDELIEMDDSVTEHSDDDLFMSPPPLALSQHDTSHREPDHTVTSQPDEADNPAPVMSQKKESNPKQRSALADLDVNRPLSPGRRAPKVFVATGLTLHQVQETKKLASLNDCKFYTKFNESVTHVIVKPAKESEFLCDRTLKLFQGIANKCWIVNYYWVMDSRHAGHLLPEGPYEIQGDTANGEQHQGPMKSRTALTDLFDRFSFLCVGDCPGLTVDDMASLFQTCGGEVVPDVDSLRNTERTPLIVTCSDIEDEDGDVQVSSQDIAMFNRLYKSHQVVTVSREWVLDSLTLYQLQPLKEYVVTSLKTMIVPKIV